MRAQASVRVSWASEASCGVSHRGVSRAIIGIVFAASLFGCDSAPETATGHGPAVRPHAPQSVESATTKPAMGTREVDGKAPLTPAKTMESPSSADAMKLGAAE